MVTSDPRLVTHPKGRGATSMVWNGDGVQQIILVSNRGPIDYAFDEDEMPIAQRGAGGVVSGLVSAVGKRPATWIALAMNDADRAVARARGKATIPNAPELANIALRLVDVPAATYDRFYEGISNRILWFAARGGEVPYPAKYVGMETEDDDDEDGEGVETETQ